MRRVGAVALWLALTIVGCTEAATIDPAGPARAPTGGTPGGAGQPSSGGQSGGAAGMADATGVGAGSPGMAAAPGMMPPGFGGALGTGGMATVDPIGSTGAAGTLSARLLPFRPIAISRDGQVVAGETFTDSRTAVRWTAMTGAVPLNGAVIPSHETRVTAISLDGSTIVGSTIVPVSGASEMTRWIGTLPMGLGHLRVTDAECALVAVNETGRTLAGHCWSTAPYLSSSQAFRWTEASGFEPVPTLPGDITNEVIAVSVDGGTIAGFSYGNQTKQAFRWSKVSGSSLLLGLGASTVVVPVAAGQDGTIIGDLFTPGATLTGRAPAIWVNGPPAPPQPIADCVPGGSFATAIGGKGHPSLGVCVASSSATKVFIADAPTQVTRLDLPAGVTFVQPVGMSDAGDVVAARADVAATGLPQLAVWRGRVARPVIVLSKLIADGVPVDIEDVVAISTSGTTIVGVGRGPTGLVGWLMQPP